MCQDMYLVTFYVGMEGVHTTITQNMLANAEVYPHARMAGKCQPQLDIVVETM